MKKQALKNKEIYRIGDKVLKAVRLPDEEIDTIVAGPDLFRRIRAAAEAEGSALAPMEPISAQKVRPLFYPMRWQMGAAAFAVLLVFAGVIGLFLIAKQDESTSNLTHPAPSVEVTPIGHGIASPPESNVELTARQDTARLRIPKIARAVKTRLHARPVRLVKEEEMGEFQALTYADDSNDKDEGGRIVRVELSRASLFAMGIDIPVENETEKVKADLFIGFDGVMKSVRFEKRN